MAGPSLDGLRGWLCPPALGGLLPVRPALCCVKYLTESLQQGRSRTQRRGPEGPSCSCGAGSWRQGPWGPTAALSLQSGLTKAVRESKISLQQAEYEFLSFVRQQTPPGLCPLAGKA